MSLSTELFRKPNTGNRLDRWNALALKKMGNNGEGIGRREVPNDPPEIRILKRTMWKKRKIRGEGIFLQMYRLYRGGEMRKKCNGWTVRIQSLAITVLWWLERAQVSEVDKRWAGQRGPTVDLDVGTSIREK